MRFSEGGQITTQPGPPLSHQDYAEGGGAEKTSSGFVSGGEVEKIPRWNDVDGVRGRGSQHLFSPRAGGNLVFEEPILLELGGGTNSLREAESSRRGSRLGVADRRLSEAVFVVPQTPSSFLLITYYGVMVVKGGLSGLLRLFRRK